MRHFLFISLFGVLLIPTFAKAESYWLILSSWGGNGGKALEKIQMKNMDQCEEQGKKFYVGDTYRHNYYCLTGK